MRQGHHVANPFAMLLNPDSIVQAMEHSERLNHLQSRICRPLDKAVIPKVADEAAKFDHEVDDSPDELQDQAETEDLITRDYVRNLY